MIRQSIRRQIVSIAVGLIVLMIVTSIMSMVMASRVAHQLDELTSKYFETYGALARMNIRSYDRALELRRMVIAKMQTPPDDAAYAEHQRAFDEKNAEMEREVETARMHINDIIADDSTSSDSLGLSRIESRIAGANDDLRRFLNESIAQLIPLLANPNSPEVSRLLARVDTLRDESTRGSRQFGST